jgi:hypothetical protein
LGANATVFVRRFDATWLGYIMAHEIKEADEARINAHLEVAL